MTLEQTLDRFIDVCAKGSGRFDPKMIKAISYNELVSPIRRYIGKSEDGKFFKINDKNRSYLINFFPKRVDGDEYKQICAIVIPNIRVKDAIRLTGMKLGIGVPSRIPSKSTNIIYESKKYGFQIIYKDIRLRTNTGWPIGMPMILIQISPL